MHVIQVRTFRLADGVDEAAFLTADAAFQAESHRRPGLVRRTLARGEDGEWLVETWCWSPEVVDATTAPSEELLAMIDASTMTVRSFETLPG